MAKRAFSWLSVLLIVALLVGGAPFGIVPGQAVEAQLPPRLYDVNGLFYGDAFVTGTAPNGADIPYTLYGTLPGIVTTRPRAHVYKYTDANGWIYFAYVWDRSAVDNVYAGNETSPANPPATQCDKDYLNSAGWGDNSPAHKWHTFRDLLRSDNLVIQMSCSGQTWNWTQDYLYGSAETGWLSDYQGGDGGGTPPSTLVSASSLQWNMTHTLWPDPTIMSPDSDRLDTNGVNGTSDRNCMVTDEIGYPPLCGDTYVVEEPEPVPCQSGDASMIGFDTEHLWEWPVVYEFAIHQTSVCTVDPKIALLVLGAHVSPPKDIASDVPLSVELEWFRAKGQGMAAVLAWKTTNEANNLGFSVFRATSADAAESERTLVTYIPSKVPPAGGGAIYRYVDRRLPRRTTFYYWLQDVSMDGVLGWSEPIRFKTR